MLDLIGYTSDRDLSSCRILEPSFGHGDFLMEIQNRLIQSSKNFSFDASLVMSHNVYGCEIDALKYDKCVQSLKILMPNFVPLKLKNEDFLCSEWDTEFDFIIGNPPYVRYENIPQAARDSYRSKFYVFYYRCDLYVLFYEHCLKALSKNGRHCFICSNRWLKNEYGKKLRSLVSSSYNLEYLIDVEKLDAFKESVLAYPAITLISNIQNENKVKIATIKNLNQLSLPLTTTQKELRGFEDWDNLFVDTDIECFSSLEEQGYKVGIGVATGADKIYISSELRDKVEHEILLPIINAKDLTGNNFKSKGLYLLNPYDSNGKLIDLEKYPKAKQYLETHKIALENRHIVKNGRAWYSLIDKIKPQLVNQPKILLPDISSNKVIFVDSGSYYPAHNIYYITGKSLCELEILAAILMSELVKKQIRGISNKMNGGLPRWQSQSIRRIKIPVIANIPCDIREQLIDAYRDKDLIAINTLVSEIEELQSKTNKPYHRSEILPSLFDRDFYGNVDSPGFGVK